MTPLHVPLLAALAGLALAVPARAQETPLVIEIRAGAALPVGSFRTGPDRGGAIATAPSFGLHFLYRGPSGWGPYVGFSQHRFDCAADGCPGAQYVATTWDIGAQRTLGGWGWLRAGVLFGRLEQELATSSLSMGAEAGAGLRFPLRGLMALTPGVRF